MSRPRRKGLRDIVGILGTRFVWSVMGVISGVILARWLGPHDRGILALVLLLPSTVVTLVKFGVSQANVYFINRKKVPVDRIASNAIIIGIVFGVSGALLVWLAREPLTADLLQGVPYWALALSLVRVPLLLLDNYLFSVLQAQGNFGTYNIRLLMSELLRLVAVLVVVVWLGLGLFGAVLIYLATTFVNVFWLFATMSRTIHFVPRLDLRLLRDILSFGIRSHVQTVTAHLLLRVDIYMVSALIGPASTAFYSIALHLTELVMEVPQAVGLVLYPRLASLPEEEVHRLTAQACRRTLMVALPAAAAIALLGPWVVTLWYGEPYAPAGEPLPFAAVGVVMMTLFVLITRNFTSRAKQRVNTLAGLLALVGNVVLNLYLIPALGIVGAALATAISYTAACAILIVFFLRESKLPIRDLFIPKRDDIEYVVETLWKLWSRLNLLPSRARGDGTHAGS